MGKSSGGSSPVQSGSNADFAASSPLGGFQSEINSRSSKQAAFLQGVPGPVAQHGKLRGHMLVARPGTQHRDREQRNNLLDPFMGKIVQGHAFGNTISSFAIQSPTGSALDAFAVGTPAAQVDGTQIDPRNSLELGDASRVRKASYCEGLENVLSDALDAA